LGGGHFSGFDRFEEFIAEPPLAGIGCSMDMLLRLCKDDKVALDLIDQAVKRPAGGDQRSEEAKTNVDNVNIDPRPDGNSEQAAIRRLRKDRRK
jgi:hypothetical protein